MIRSRRSVRPTVSVNEVYAFGLAQSFNLGPNHSQFAPWISAWADPQLRNAPLPTFHYFLDVGLAEGLPGDEVFALPAADLDHVLVIDDANGF